MLHSIFPPIFADFWFYYLPDFLMAALLWTCVGRFLLGFFFTADSENFIWRFFRRLTDPAIGLVEWITPRFVLAAFLPLVTAFWLMILRVVFWILMYNNGLAPRLADYGITG